MEKTKILLPNCCLPVGVVLLALGVVLGFMFTMFDISVSWNMICQTLGLTNVAGSTASQAEGSLELSAFGSDSDLMFTTSGILFVIGSMMTGFSRLKDEDEYMTTLRLRSLVASLYLYATSMVITLICCWGVQFLVVVVYESFAMFAFYLLSFYWQVFSVRRKLRSVIDE